MLAVGVCSARDDDVRPSSPVLLVTRVLVPCTACNQAAVADGDGDAAEAPPRPSGKDLDKLKAQVVGMKRTASEVTPEQPPDVLEEGSLSPLLKDFEGFDGEGLMSPVTGPYGEDFCQSGRSPTGSIGDFYNPELDLDRLFETVPPVTMSIRIEEATWDAARIAHAADWSDEHGTSCDDEEDQSGVGFNDAQIQAMEIAHAFDEAMARAEAVYAANMAELEALL